MYIPPRPETVRPRHIRPLSDYLNPQPKNPAEGIPKDRQCYSCGKFFDLFSGLPDRNNIFFGECAACLTIALKKKRML